LLVEDETRSVSRLAHTPVALIIRDRLVAAILDVDPRLLPSVEEEAGPDHPEVEVAAQSVGAAAFPYQAIQDLHNAFAPQLLGTMA
jgi:hypothetical protein